MSRRTLVAVVISLAAGCVASHSTDAGPEPCVRDDAFVEPCNPSVVCTPSTQVDLLFMIDDSGSMTEHQIQLRDQIPRMIQIAATGIRDMAHGGPFAPPHSLHVGVVSSTMGLGPVTGVPRCPAGFGNDGVLFTRSPFPAPGCPTTDYATMYPHGVFEFNQGQAMPTAAEFASDASCVALLGTAGCELEFQMEAVLEALAPAPDSCGASSVWWTAPGYVPPTFYGGTFGHGGDQATNGSFLRPNSFLAIIALTDEDDGSTDDYVIFSDDPRYSGFSLNVRPVAFSNLLFPVERYISGLIGLRRQPSMLFFSAITGIPNDLSPGLSLTDPALLTRILADPRMQPTIDPLHPERLLPVCMDTTGGQTAVPGLRMVQVAQGLLARGANVSVSSICRNDYTPALDGIIGQIARRGP